MEANPYRTDIPGSGPFFGREEELAKLVDAVRRRRHAIAAVMGGRGMGKTSFALELERRLSRLASVDCIFVRHPGGYVNFLGNLSQRLGCEVSTSQPLETLVSAIRGARSDLHRAHPG